MEKELYLIELYWWTEEKTEDETKPIFITDDPKVAEDLNKLSGSWGETISRRYREWRETPEGERGGSKEYQRDAIDEVFGKWAKHIDHYEGGWLFQSTRFTFVEGLK